MKDDSFALRRLDFFGIGRHIAMAAAIDKMNVARSHAQRRTHAVHRHIAAADDDNRVGQLGGVDACDVVVNLQQKADTRFITRHCRVFVDNAQFGSFLATQRQKNRAIAARKQIVDGIVAAECLVEQEAPAQFGYDVHFGL